MKLVIVVAAAAGLAGASVLLAQSLGHEMAAAEPSSFTEACAGSLSSAAEWTIGEAEKRGKDVSLVKRAQIGFKIPAICSCAQDALKREIADNHWQLAGQLTGLQTKLALATRAKNRSVAQSARESLRSELGEVMAAHNVSSADVGKMSRTIDGALRGCFKKHLG